MWAAGFVAEVEGLAADGLREGPTASRALGYAQVLALLDGELTAGRGARAHGAHHPPLRAPAAVVVPPRRGHSPGSTPPAPTCSTRSPPRSPPVRSGRDRLPPGAPGTAPRTTSSCCPTPTAPSGRRTGSTPRWCAGSATAGRASAATASCGWSAARTCPTRRLLGTTWTAGVVHGPPQRRRLARRDVRQRDPGVPARAGQRGPARPRFLRGRRPGRHPRRAAPRRAPPPTAATGSTWAPPGRSAPARPACPAGCSRAWPSDGQPAPGLFTDVAGRGAGPDRRARGRPGALPGRRERRVRQLLEAGAHVRLRVSERGVGETRSCGTGACAAAYAALAADGRAEGTVRSTSPVAGCRCRSAPSTTVLTGPAVLVSVGTLCPEWLAG